MIDLDADARGAAMQRIEGVKKAKGPVLPAIITWDFAVAFPPVSHQFLWTVLSRGPVSHADRSPAAFRISLVGCTGRDLIRVVTATCCSTLSAESCKAAVCRA